MRDREISYGLVERAAAAGFDSLLFTVDTPIAGNRMRDARNGFSIPPQLTARTILDAIPRPWWWWDFLTTPPLEFASLTSTGGTVGQLLDTAPVPFHLLPKVVREVGGEVEIIVDTGIMHGADIVASIALGASLTLVGRAYLYGLMSGGRQGVDRAIEILSSEVARTMKLLQVASIEELEPRHVTQLSALQPRDLGQLHRAAEPGQSGRP